MVWFLTTDEGVASLQGLTEGLDSERIIQREAIISVLKDLKISSANDGDECDWNGITCNEIGHIIKIELNGENLSGTISSDISKLVQLRIFDIGSNFLYGEVPVQIGDLRLLEYLDLSGNNFSGIIPSGLGQMQELEFLYLRK